MKILVQYKTEHHYCVMIHILILLQLMAKNTLELKCVFWTSFTSIDQLKFGI